MSAAPTLGVLRDLDAQLHDLVDLGLLREDFVDGQRCYFPLPDYDVRLERARKIVNGGRP